MNSLRRGSRAVTVAASGITLVAVVSTLSLWLRGRGVDVQYNLFIFHNAPTAVVLPWLSWLIITRQRGNIVGPVLMWIAALAAAHVAAAAIADAAIVAWGHTAPVTGENAFILAEMPLSATVPFWVMNWLWLPQVVLLLTILPVIFPNGRLPGARWRAVPALAGLGGSLFLVGLVIDGWPTASWDAAQTPAVVEALLAVGLVILSLATVLSVAGLCVHWRRAAPDQRRPFQVVGTALGVAAVLWVSTYPWPTLWMVVMLLTIHLLLIAYALAVARSRLHDLEPVLSKGVVAGTLSFGVAAVFAAAVLFVGLLTAQLTDSGWLPFVAVALVAVVAEPTRRGARRLIDRLVFRLAADREQVLSTIAARAVQDRGPLDLMTVVDALLRGTGADRVEAWLVHGGEETLAAMTGTTSKQAEVLTEPITSQGERLGELRLSAHLLSDLAPGAPGLLADVAHVTGAALRSSRLAAALEEQLDQLQASRRRLVQAQDTARRGMERDLHDGAQAQLIAVRLRLAVLQARASKLDGRDLREELAGVATDVDAAIGTMRDLARGLHPPILDQEGVAVALRAQSRGLPIPVSIHADGFGRYDAAIESSLYFACLELIQNAARHSDAHRIDVSLSAAADQVWFAVSDDGCGFNPSPRVPTEMTNGLANVEDRLGALGGRLVIESLPGFGTRISGAVPLDWLAGRQVGVSAQGVDCDSAGRVRTTWGGSPPDEAGAGTSATGSDVGDRGVRLPVRGLPGAM